MKKVTIASLSRDLDIAKSDIRKLTGIIAVFGVGIQYLLKASAIGSDYSITSTSQRIGPDGITMLNIASHKVADYPIPALETLFQAKLGATSLSSAL